MFFQTRFKTFLAKIKSVLNLNDLPKRLARKHMGLVWKFRYRRDLKRFTRLLTVNRRMVVCMRFLNSMFVWLFLLFFKNFTLILRNSLLFPDLDRLSPFSISFPDSEKAV